MCQDSGTSSAFRHEATKPISGILETDHAPVSEPVVGEEAGADQHQAKESAHEREAHAGEQKIAIDSQSHDVSRSYPRTKFLELPEAPYSLERNGWRWDAALFSRAGRERWLKPQTSA